jgi:hypothetical protein
MADLRVDELRVDELRVDELRVDELRGDDANQRAATVGDVGVLVTFDGFDGETIRGFANVCRHRGHELLPSGGAAVRPSMSCMNSRGLCCVVGRSRRSNERVAGHAGAPTYGPRTGLAVVHVGDGAGASWPGSPGAASSAAAAPAATEPSSAVNTWSVCPVAVDNPTGSTIAATHIVEKVGAVAWRECRSFPLSPG